jgi:hypothetical protein
MKYKIMALLFIGFLWGVFTEAVAQDNAVIDPDVPDKYVMHYTEEVDLVLYPTECTASDPSNGYKAKALHVPSGEAVQGCWRRSGRGGQHIELHLRNGKNIYSYKGLPAEAFKPEWEAGV